MIPPPVCVLAGRAEEALLMECQSRIPALPIRISSFRVARYLANNDCKSGSLNLTRFGLPKSNWVWSIAGFTSQRLANSDLSIAAVERLSEARGN
jgi:hypothetical protein